MTAEDDIAKGVQYLEQGDMKKAATHFTSATRAEPENYNAWLYLGISNNELEKYEEALQAFTRCTEINPELPFAWSNLGIVYQRMHDNAEAIRHFVKALKLDPYDLNNRLNLGLAYLQMRNKELEAMGQFEYILDHDKRSFPEAWHQLGMIFIDLKQKEYALYCFEQAKELGIMGKNNKMVLDLKFDEIKAKNPFDDEVKEAAFNPFK